MSGQCTLGQHHLSNLAYALQQLLDSGQRPQRALYCRMLQSARRAPCLQNALAALSRAPASLLYQTSRGITQTASDAPAQASQAATPLPSAAFSDHEAIFQDQPTSALLRALLVFRFCAIPAFVRNAETLLNVSKTVLGDRLTTFLVRETFFKHFCAGEDDAEVQATTRKLQSRGIGSILDYAAEDDVKPESKDSKAKADKQKQANKEEQWQLLKAQGAKAGSGSSAAAGIGTSTATPPPTDAAHLSPASGQPVLTASPAVARQFDYKNEEQCDAHVNVFLSSIDSASRMPGQGFAAVKLTALGNPRLLERVSSAIQEVRALFAKWDTDGSGFLDKSEFKTAYMAMLEGASEEEQKMIFKWMDTQKQGKIDYVAWCQRLSLTRMPEFALRIKPEALGDTTGPAAASWRHSLQEVALTDQEVKLVHACRGRLMRLAEAAAKQHVKLMIDAEHTYMQPAIDHLTLELMCKYNTQGNVIIYNTYQAYLKDSHTRLVLDLERARREGYTLGAKLVRGAYLGMERARAMSLGYPSPVWDTLEDTHHNYSVCMEELLVKVQQRRAEVMLGTHNQVSVEQAVARMAELGLDPSHSPVYFGQLLGMSDHLTRVLGGAGYNAYKYVPYGKVEQVIPYLLRRAAENAAIMQGTKRDVQMLQAELGRRLRVAVGGR